MAGHDVMWQFQVRPEHRADFERYYGAEGDWVRLFRRSPEYLETRLVNDAAEPDSYMTVDRWKDEASFRMFREQFARMYEELDRECETFTLRERYVAAVTTSPRGLLIDTQRLRMRQFQYSDAEFVLHLVNEPLFLRFIGDKGVRTLGDAREYIRKGPLDSYLRFGFGMYLVALKASGAPIGMCGLVKRDVLEDVDIGFALLSQFHGQGYGFEAASAVLAHATHGLSLRRIAGICRPDNEGSIRVLGKLGLKPKGTVRIVPDGPQDQLYVRDL
jgi:[ribosomal protein S5]-alanine N-acetyltransferase